MPVQNQLAPSGNPILGNPEEFLMDRLHQLETRVALLERQDLHEASVYGAKEATASPEVRLPEPASPSDRASVLDPASMTQFLGLMGRTFLALAGAFTLRTLTSAGILPPLAGLGLGLGYAAAWALAADLAARRGNRRSALFHALTAASIFYPQVWEIATRLALVPPAAGAGMLFGFNNLLMTVAWRGKLKSFAWITTLATLVTGFTIMISTSAIAPFCALFLALGAVSLATSEREGWGALRGFAALAADLAVLWMMAFALGPHDTPELVRYLPAPAVLALSLGLAGVYLGHFVWRAVRETRTMRAGETFQALAALVIGYGGGVWVALSAGQSIAPMGVAALVAGLGCYALALTFMSRKPEGWSNLPFLTTLALVLVLAGGLTLFRGSSTAWVFAGLGLAAMTLGRRLRLDALLVHGTLLLGAAAGISGLLGLCTQGFLAGAGDPRPSFTLASGAALAAILAGHLLVAFRPRPEPGARFLSLCLAGGLGLLGLLGLAALAVNGIHATTPGSLAASRTAMLAAITVIAGLLGRWIPAGALGRLVYPLLGASALKLLLEDPPCQQW